MVVDLVAGLEPFVLSAVTAYGGAVLARGQEMAADATIGVGRGVLQRIFGVREEGEELPESLADLAEDPEDEERRAALRLKIRKMLAADAELAQEIQKMLPAAVGGRDSAGTRSVVAQTISGVVVTGDGNQITR
ncbi:hypothetical protein ABGB12_18095 [Actinocorallia sp. B10E7]|uniref:hypothetical protein n=1 Tax=Actinocorallia sp. B10E7 TaxID=3153558 RepID=UPI00325C6890